MTEISDRSSAVNKVGSCLDKFVEDHYRKLKGPERIRVGYIIKRELF